MKKHILLFILGMILLSSVTYGQLYYGGDEPAQVPETPYASASYLHDASADVASGGKVTMHEARLQRLWPLIWDDPLLLTASADLRWTRLNLDDAGVEDFNLYTIAGVFDLIYEGLYPWIFEANLKAGLYSELEEIDGDDARIRGGFRARHPVNSAISLNAGLVYNEAFGDDEWYPVGGVVWTPAPEWEFRLQYPDPRISFAPTRNLLAYIEAAPAGGNWTTFYQKQEYGLRMESMRYGGGIECAVSGDFWVRLFGGINTDRRFHMWKGSDVPLDSKADDSFYAGLALILR